MKMWSVIAVTALAAQAAWAAPGPGGPRPGGRMAGPGAAAAGMPGGRAMGGCPMMGGMMGMAGRGMRGMGGPAGTPMGIPPVAAMLLMHREMLGLTDQQADRLRAIQGAQARQQIRATAEIRVAQMDLADLMMQPAPSRTKVEALIRDIGRRMTDLQVANANAALDALAALTPQQRDQVLQMARSGGCPMMGAMGAPGSPMGGAATPPAPAPVNP